MLCADPGSKTSTENPHFAKYRPFVYAGYSQTSANCHLFFVPTDKKSIHWPLYKASLQRPLSSVSKVAVVGGSNCSPTSSKNSHFQNEAKCKTLLMKMRFICMRLKNRFHINGFALSLALKQRLEATAK